MAISKSDFDLSIYVSAEKFPSCSKMLPCSVPRRPISVNNFDELNCKYSDDLVKMRKLFFRARAGRVDPNTLGDFESYMRSLLIADEKGGLKIYFEAFYNSTYVDSLTGDTTKQNKMLQFHSVLETLLGTARKSGAELRQSYYSEKVVYEKKADMYIQQLAMLFEQSGMKKVQSGLINGGKLEKDKQEPAAKVIETEINILCEKHGIHLRCHE